MMSYVLLFVSFLIIQVIFQMNIFESLLFLTTIANSFIIKLKKDVLIQAYKINRAKQH